MRVKNGGERDAEVTREEGVGEKDVAKERGRDRPVSRCRKPCRLNDLNVVIRFDQQLFANRVNEGHDVLLS